MEANTLISPTRGAAVSRGFIDLNAGKQQDQLDGQETNMQPVSLEMRSSQENQNCEHSSNEQP